MHQVSGSLKLSQILFTFPSRYLFTIGHLDIFRLGRWASHFQTELHVFCPTLTIKSNYGPTGLLPSMEILSRWFRNKFNLSESFKFGLTRVRSPLLTGSRLISFILANQMFQFTSFNYFRSNFHYETVSRSETCTYQPLLAQCRLSQLCTSFIFIQMPRHPPNALSLFAYCYI